MGRRGQGDPRDLGGAGARAKAEPQSVAHKPPQQANVSRADHVCREQIIALLWPCTITT